MKEDYGLSTFALPSIITANQSMIIINVFPAIITSFYRPMQARSAINRICKAPIFTRDCTEPGRFMDFVKYLERIGIRLAPTVSYTWMATCHRNHIFHVPFENLDVHLDRKIILDLQHIYEKVVNDYRGGFCYELNYIFNSLLREFGFSTYIISARIFDSDKKPGPEFDHMAIIVKCNDKHWLLDVGFGDLFITPLELAPGETQTDGRNYFKIERYSGQEWILSMSADGKNYEQKYLFTTTPARVESFHKLCLHKQTHPDSYFVKNLVCTKPTENGRITLFNNRFIEKTGDFKSETMIENRQELLNILNFHFGISIPM